MEITQVLHKPILTEKTNVLQSSNTYTWEVDWSANKYQIKEAVEFIFKVKVVRVNILKVDKKPKRVGRFNGFTNRYKKAMITLADGDKIVYYPNEAEAQDAKKEAKVKAQKVESKKQAEAKEAEIAKKLAAKKAKVEKTTKSTTSKSATKKASTKKSTK
ncbi:50S ribosomal protein L23 [Mycoplasmopsis caviae]|uniref:Large ribosomal subunit protein uL23 n=1 Tax=Mycoplasmopsis caviae TaxID=55603 RepID=A0A3P8KN45_9BACT|nr:50S ribosomal protein L23 [Mycoplasmopsis caviae]UUD34874.1 50S ribosomal protein L23 [Mycoplasmopsis caviae]VDR42278.1 50S ribosomal protein L23 [Mycoplasmopsis caviae]